MQDKTAADRAIESGAPLPAAAPTDTYFAAGSLWHLDGTWGVRAAALWDEFTGAGVRVAVFDDGIEWTHPDLDGNADIAAGYDAFADAPGGLPVGNADRHGTAVAGLIAAERNGQGVVGVAYDATLVSIRQSYNSSDIGQLARGFAWAEAHADIVNDSWGYRTAYVDNFMGAHAGPGAAIEHAAEFGRGGLGLIVVQSAGNERASASDVNYHDFQANRFAIAVAASDATGAIASFSTPGAAVLVTAPGVAIYSTDREDGRGYNTSAGGGDGDPLADTDYTSTFGGTSAAAPIVSGVVALMLDANPGLGWRDVQEILAYSARQTGVVSGYQFNGASDWNGAGLHFSRDFGAGLVDATAAVRLAESWGGTARTSLNDLAVSASASPNVALPDYSAGGSAVLSTVTIASGLDLDRVEVVVNVDHAYAADLRIWLTSPSGLTSTLAPGGIAGSDWDSWTFDSVQFWGEDGVGAWTLAVRDMSANDVGTLESWTLVLWGDADTADDRYVYTDEFAEMFARDPANAARRATLADGDGGVDTLNAAAVSSDLRIDLGSGAATIDGQALAIAPGEIENAAGGDGDDTLAGSGGANNLAGGRGADTVSGGGGGDLLDGGAGADTLTGGAGNDTLIGGGGADVAVFAALRAAATVLGTPGASTTLTVVSAEGADVVSGIETLRFADLDMPTNNAPVFGAGGLGGAVTEDGTTVAGGEIAASDGDPVVYSGGGAGAHGTLSIAAGTGVWSYTLANSQGAVQALDTGETLLDAFAVTASDGSAFATDTLAITIHGANDAPVFGSSGRAGVVAEDGAATAGGTLLAADVDIEPVAYTAGPAAYGALTLGGSSGIWGYTLADASAAVQGLDSGEILVDLVAVTASDGAATDVASIAVTIQGANDAPVFGTGGFAGTVAEDGAQTASGTLAATDIDIETVAFSGGGAGARGSLALNAVSGAWTYTLSNATAAVQGLDSGETAVDTFTVTASDGTAVDLETIRVTIHGANDAPEIGATGRTGTVTEDALLAISRTVSATDADIEPIAFSGGGTGTFGSLALDPATGGWLYTLDNLSAAVQALDSGETALDVFALTASDGSAVDVEAITITVQGTNDAPVLGSGGLAGTVSEDGALAASGTLSATDIDVEPATFSGGGAGARGSLALNAATGAWTYTLSNASAAVQGLDSGETAVDAFTVTASDGTAVDTDTILVTIHGANDAPVLGAGGRGGTAAEDGAATAGGTLAASDVDVEPVTFAAGAAAYGTLALGPGDGVWSYTLANGAAAVQALDSGETLVDLIAATVSDGTAADVGAIAVTIHGANDAPVFGTGGLAGTVAEDGAQTASGTLAASDVDVETVTFSGGGAGARGSLALNPATGAWTYTLSNASAAVQGLDSGEAAVDTFTVTASDGTAVDLDTILITIHGANDAPVLGAGGRGGTLAEDGAAIAGGTLTATDIDVESLTFSAGAGTYGALTLGATSGVWGYTVANASSAVQALDSGETLVDLIAATVSDGTAADVGTIAVTIQGANDAPVFGTGGLAGTVAEDGAQTALGTLAATDIDLETVTFSGGGAGARGSLVLDATTGTWTYTLANASAAVQGLDSGETAVDAFAVTASDGAAVDFDTILVTIHGANDAPVLGSGGLSGVVSEDGGAIAGGTLDASDIDIEPLAFSGGGAGTFGTLSLNAATGGWSYTLANASAAVEALDAGETLVDAFDVTVSDGTTIDVDTILVTANGANDAPVAAADSYTFPEGAAFTVAATSGVLANDSDPDIEALTAILLSSPLNGTLALAADGGFVYTPAPGWFGSDQFSYRAGDGTATSQVAVARLTVLQTAQFGRDGASDTLAGDGNADIVYGGATSLEGGSGPDTLLGLGGPDTLWGLDGDDRLAGGPGDDTLQGGDGVDTADFADAAGPVRATLSGGAGTASGGAGADVLAGIENLAGGGGGDTLAGDSGGNALDGGDGDDSLAGGDGGDALLGAAGADTARGEAGDDWIEGGGDGDALYGGDGGDAMFGDAASPSGGADLLYGGGGGDYLSGGAGRDALSGEDGADWIEAGDGNDTAEGGAGGDFLNGEAGDDTAYGGAGGDGMFGLAGDDALWGGDGDPIGDDWIWGDDFAGAAFAGRDLIYGGGGLDVLIAGAGADTVYGGGDLDYAEAGDGDDRVWGEAGDDWILLGAGDDRLYGGDGNDVGGGDLGEDRLWGGAGVDALWGGPGDDTLEGGAGIGDTLFGGLGDADVFVVAPGAGWDAIADWDDGADRIRVQGMSYADAAGFLAAGGFVADPGGGGERVVVIGFGTVGPGAGVLISLSVGSLATIDTADLIFIA